MEYKFGWRALGDDVINFFDELPEKLKRWSWNDFWFKDWDNLEPRGVIWNLILCSYLTLVLQYKIGWLGVLIAIGMIAGGQWCIYRGFKDTYLLYNQEEYRGSFQFTTLPRIAIMVGLVITSFIWTIG